MVTQEQTAPRELTAEDRCDHCGAAAKVIATFIAGELMFCGHHAKEFRLKLKNQSLSVYDPDEMLAFAPTKYS
jgi:hypothetical protein